MTMRKKTLKEFPNYIIQDDGQVWSKGAGKFLAKGLSHNGYSMVILQHNCVRKTVRVGRLIGECFIPNPENKPTINHKNGIKTDDRAENLEWATCSENTIHFYKTGLQTGSHGERSAFHKLKLKQVREIRKFKNPNCKELARKYNVSPRTIYRILIGETWTKDF